MTYAEALTMFDAVFKKLADDGYLKDSYKKQVASLRSTLSLLAKAEHTFTRKAGEHL